MNTSLKLFFTTVLLLMAFAAYGLYTFGTTVFWPISAPICVASVLLVGFCWYNVGGFSVYMRPEYGNTVAAPIDTEEFDIDNYVDEDDFE